MSPRECPRCGGANIIRIDGRTDRPRAKGRALFRWKRCTDCGFTGPTAEFWVVGAGPADIAAELAGLDRADFSA